MTIGFIGLGNLGIAIAENLIEFQKPLYVYNRTAAKALPLKEKGAEICSSVKELATQCDIVFSIVSDDAALNEITTGDQGIAAHLRKGGIHISLSTVLPSTAVALNDLHRKQGTVYVACPVMARPEVARARKINFLISGDLAAIETAKPLLQQAGGVNVWEFGQDPGAANVAKLCSNYMVIAAVEAMAEGINLAKRSGIDTQHWLNMLTQTYLSAPVYVNYSRMIMQEAFTPAAFSLRLGLKDVNLILKQAESVHASMPVGEQIKEVLDESMSSGYGEMDLVAMAKQINTPSQMAL